MKYLLIALMAINFLLIVSFFYGITNIFKEETAPKKRAFYSIFLSVLIFCYLWLILITGLQYLLNASYSRLPFMFMFFVFPFAVGNFVSYKKLGLFSAIQIIIFILSLIYFTYLYVKL